MRLVKESAAAAKVKGNPNKDGTEGTAAEHITAAGVKNGDVDGDGLTVNDALQIQKYLLGELSL